MFMATFCIQCVTSFFGMKKQGNLNYFQDNYLIRRKFGTEGYFYFILFLGPGFKFINNFHVWHHFDVTMTKRQNIYILETERVYDIITTSFLNKKNLTFCTRSERVLKIPVRIELKGNHKGQRRQRSET